jgi:hypothetical protein
MLTRKTTGTTATTNDESSDPAAEKSDRSKRDRIKNKSTSWPENISPATGK